MESSPAHRAVLAAWRVEQPRLITTLSRLLRDVALAEELTQDALVAALESWPKAGVPERPGAWLMATARRRAFDLFRRRRMLERKHALVAADEAREQLAMPDFDAPLDDDIGDEMLRLIFTACHPRLPPEARSVLALRLVCGLTAAEIARAFLAKETAIAQRIVRAKRTLAQAGLTYETPSGDQLSARLRTVLEVIYLIFNEGYAAASGDDWLRPQLCNEAIRLGRVLTAVAPHEPEAWGLLALMELNASRAAARVDAHGDPVLLLEQDRTRWDQLQIRRGRRALAQAGQLGGAGGYYALQAAIVACHANAPTAAETDWRRIRDLYTELAALTPSPVVELNRAIAVGMTDGPQAALAIVDRLGASDLLRAYHLLPSVRGDLLFKLGRFDEAHAAFAAAAALAQNSRERALLKRRASASVAAAGFGPGSDRDKLQ